MSRCCSSYIGLGSNLDDPPRQLDEALRRLQAERVAPCCVSSLYRTEPVGKTDQPWFYNRVASVHFDDTPRALLRICRSIETSQGRAREQEVPNGPRTLDLDLLFHGGVVLDTPELTLPHPRLTERRFVLVPMTEIAPELEDPRSGLTMRELLERCADPSVVERLAAD